MAQTLSVTEAPRHFAEYINRVVYRGESFVLVRGNTPIAELRPLPAGRRLGRHGRGNPDTARCRHLSSPM